MFISIWVVCFEFVLVAYIIWLVWVVCWEKVFGLLRDFDLGCFGFGFQFMFRVFKCGFGFALKVV